MRPWHLLVRYLSGWARCFPEHKRAAGRLWSCPAMGLGSCGEAERRSDRTGRVPSVRFPIHNITLRTARGVAINALFGNAVEVCILGMLRHAGGPSDVKSAGRHARAFAGFGE